ncbi:MAG: hypothetical protein DMG65_07395 [Candidatus Angelobacter sp. Gp1-AA117]|nr:MAG: hypothetical protein DMG65_07395 [Candidatus Angelobacter sp. Gp1-AA117]
MAVSSRKKTVLALLLTLALGIFVPPNVNGTRFSKRLASSLSNALGRQVKIGSVKFRLLPRPGFDLYDFQVLDDPNFSAEPLLLCGQVTADVRLTSLWQGRLEIANLKLQNATDRTPPSLNLVYRDGHWNLEWLLVRAEQVPTAPTDKKRAEQRPRFPYIEADAGRINVKVGLEKKPYALTNTDFALWLPAEDHWHVRLEGRPVRTDMNLSDTGTIKIEGDLKRSSDLHETPVKMQFFWRDAQLGQLTSLVLGQDRGWRGGLNLNVQLFGSLTDMHMVADAGLESLRRYDIDRNSMPGLHTRCLGEYLQGLLDFNCSLPLENGSVKLAGKFSLSAPSDYQMSIAAQRVPLSVLAVFARHAKRTLPDDLEASGTLDADFSFANHQWAGNGDTSPFSLRSAVAAQPVQVSAIHFHAGIPEESGQQPAKKKRVAKVPAQIAPVAFIVDPFTIRAGAGAPLHAQANLTATGYEIETQGAAPLERMIELGKISGFRSRISNTTGSADFNVNMNGVWAGFAPSHLGGTAHLRDVTASIPGIRQHLLLESGVQFTDEAVVLSNITARFERLPFGLSGSVSSPVNCASETPCPIQFDLHADSFGAAEFARLMGMDQKNWKLPFLSASEKLPDFRAAGTFSADTFDLAKLAMEKFSAHVEIGDHALLVSRINARVAGGTTQGDWSADWSTSPVRYSGSGILTGVAPDHLGIPMLASWITGKANLKYSLKFSGLNGPDMLASATGQADFAVTNGISQAVALEGSKPTRFQNFQGACALDSGLLSFSSGKLRAENRIYEISGSVSLADKQAKLKVSGSATQWEITGALDNPNVAAQRLTAQDIPAHTQQ